MTVTLLNQLINALTKLGLTTYEAKAYMALLQQHPANGHEISRASGVPGPKIYETINKLTIKGLVVPLQTNPITYEPLPLEEFLKGKQKEFENTCTFCNKT